MSTVRRIPEGFHTVTPYLIVNDAARAIEFYKSAFNAKELYRCECDTTGRVLNAKIRIGDSIIMLNDEFPEYNCTGPLEDRPSPVSIHLYVHDADRFVETAVAAGATVTLPMCDAFWGDRFGKIRDPFHHQWSIATHIEDVAPNELKERAKNAFG